MPVEQRAENEWSGRPSAGPRLWLGAWRVGTDSRLPSRIDRIDAIISAHLLAIKLCIHHP